MTARRDFDVVIAGGGMVGAAVAALLVTGPATASLKVALIEPRPALPPRPEEPLDLRVSALSRAAQNLLTAVGAWPRVLERQPCAYERMIVWDGAAPVDGPDTLVFDAADAGEPDLGHIAENRAVAAALIERAVAAGVVLLSSPVNGLELAEDAAWVTLDERRLAAGLVVASDGADSKLRGLAAVEGHGTAYPQEAVVGHLAAAHSHGRAARQRFLPSGPIALLPLADGRVSLVWSTTPEQAAELVAMGEDAFGAAVTRASDGVLGDLQAMSPRARFPLRRFQADRYVATRLALVGDAAHLVHPLAGQGVNQGFGDAAALVGEIGVALARGEDFGDPRTLGRYGRARRADNVLMGAALDGLWHLFADQHAAVRRARRTGLGLVNRVAPLKRLFIARALGA
ncbi:MAG TPA: FAD-dependent monooxygenase [Steroidobacteraceae bacterium]|nr:FAD-dependent monooxygenase [Steroidobacteraceae bacterium]